MSRSSLASVVLVCAIAATLPLAACSKPKATDVPSSTSQTPSAVPAAPVPQPVVASPTPAGDATTAVTTPPAGSGERSAILNAARSRITSDRAFVVMQLFVAGDVAVADLASERDTGAVRRLVGFRRTSGKWQAVWIGAVSAEGKKALAAAMPDVPARLLSRIVITAVKPSPSDPTASLKSTAASAALKAAKGQAGSDLGTLSVGQVRLAKDGAGSWWASVVVQPSKPGYDSLPVYLHRASGVWKVIDLGTGIEPGSDDRFPADVRGKL